MRRIVAAIKPGESLRKIDIAKRVGIGRGSANRAVDALHEKGYLVGKSDHFALPNVRKGRLATIESRILAMLTPGKPVHVSEILKRFSDVRESSVSVQVLRMTHAGLLRQVARGTYELSDVTPNTSPRLDLHEVVFAMTPGRVFDTPTLAREIGIQISAAALALRRLVVSGMVVKVSRGRYARTGAKPDLAPSALHLVTVVRETMSREDRIWATSEIQAVLNETHPGTVAAWTMNNMRKGGHLERVVPGRWRLLPKVDAPDGYDLARKQSSAIVASISDILSSGGLHNVEDLAEACGTTVFVTHSILRDLERKGLSVRFIGRRWRWAIQADTSCDEGSRFDTGRVAKLLVELGGPVTLRDLTPSPFARMSTMLKALATDGIVERTGYYHHRIAPTRTKTLHARLSPHARSPISSEDHAILDMFGESRAMTASDLAEFSASCPAKMEDSLRRLLAAHRLVEIETGRFMAC